MTADEPSEYILSHEPFVVRRRAKWTDCDPAGVVWTGNFFEYAGSATRSFLAYLVRKAGLPEARVAGTNTPIKAYSFVFHRSLWPEEMFDVRVKIVAIRNSTFEMQIAGTIEGAPVFDCTITSICVNGSREKIPVPPDLRAALEGGA